MQDNWSAQHRSNVTSQCGEDGMISKIFENVSPTNKWCVEFGAHDGKWFSNTWNLINNENWASVQIEGHIDRYKELAERYNTNDSIICLHRMVGFESPDLLDEILSPHKVPYNFDFLSLDVDGFDYQIWRAFVKYQPRVVCIECYSDNLNNRKPWIHGEELVPRAGSSVRAMALLGKEKDYELVGTTAVNAFFVLKDLYSCFKGIKLSE